jgi:enoyl-CoA hydratase/carnithine racemase
MDPVRDPMSFPMDETTLVSLVGGGLTRDELGPVWNRPMIAVAIKDAEQTRRLLPLVGDLACVTVGVAERSFPDPVGFDVYLCPDDGADEPWVPCPRGVPDTVAGLEATVSAHPIASLVLVQLLRLGSTLDTADGLVAESLAYAVLQAGADHRAWLGDRVARPQRAPDPVPVLAQRVDATIRLTLNRPHVRNAYSAAMRDALVESLRIAVADPEISDVIITGAGPDFCSGGDLDEFGTADDPSVAHGVRSTRNAGAWIDACAERCTALVHGSCVGAGTELAAFAGRAVAAPGTRFLLPELSMGLVPGAGGTVSLPRRIGRPRTAWLALSGTALGAATALRWGLVDEVADGRLGGAGRGVAGLSER